MNSKGDFPALRLSTFYAESKPTRSSTSRSSASAETKASVFRLEFQGSFGNNALLSSEVRLLRIIKINAISRPPNRKNNSKKGNWNSGYVFNVLPARRGIRQIEEGEKSQNETGK